MITENHAQHHVSMLQKAAASPRSGSGAPIVFWIADDGGRVSIITLLHLHGGIENCCSYQGLEDALRTTRFGRPWMTRVGCLANRLSNLHLALDLRATCHPPGCSGYVPGCWPWCCQPCRYVGARPDRTSRIGVVDDFNVAPTAMLALAALRSACTTTPRACFSFHVLSLLPLNLYLLVCLLNFSRSSFSNWLRASATSTVSSPASKSRTRTSHLPPIVIVSALTPELNHLRTTEHSSRTGPLPSPISSFHSP